MERVDGQFAKAKLAYRAFLLALDHIERIEPDSQGRYQQAHKPDAHQILAEAKAAAKAFKLAADGLDEFVLDLQTHPGAVA